MSVNYRKNYFKKKFNGKDYQYQGISTVTKDHALRESKKLKNKGYFVRIVQIRFDKRFNNIHIPRYTLFARKKR